jgi:two-component system chemotaxis sensor kinase CheA
MTDKLDVAEFISGFLAEAEELLSSANRNLLAADEALRRGESAPRAVRELFRSLHTLKGLSAMVGAEPIVDLTHEMETLLRKADGAGGRLPPNAVDVLLRGVRAVEERVAALARREPLPPAPPRLVEELASLHVEAGTRAPVNRLSLEPELVAKLSSAEQEQLAQGVARGLRAVRVDFVPSPARSEQGLNITSVRARVGALGELVKVLPRAVAPSAGAPGGVTFVLLLLTSRPDTEVAEAAAASPSDIQLVAAPAVAEPAPEELTLEAPVDGGDLQKRNVVRVDVSRLDEALERLSMLVVTRSRLQRAVSELARDTPAARSLTGIVAEVSRQLRDLRAAIMRARMVPVGELLERAPLIVRGLTRNSSKLVRLTVDVGHAELDKAVAERIFPVVVHLLRNAVDHAIEPASERKAAGKPEEGNIRLRCAEQSDGRLQLIVEDDGRGIDRHKVAERAQSPVPETDAELLELITRPGLSTSESVTRTSGRGMGMDIVKRITVNDLGGELTVRTTPGAGTTFTLRVPVSVTIVEAFSLACGDQTFVVPVSSVEDLAEVSQTAIVAAPRPGAHGIEVRLLRHRGATLPLYSLAETLGAGASAPERPKAIVVRAGAEAFAFQVDRMLGQQEVVIRPIEDPLVSVPGVSGTTDLGDGRPTLVLDLVGLVRQLQSRAQEATR